MQVIIINGEEIFLEWHVDEDNNIKPISVDQPVITINGKFPGPLVTATTNDNIHVNVFNDMNKYHVLITVWNGSNKGTTRRQDGVSEPTVRSSPAGGAFGPIRIDNRAVIQPPFAEPEGDFDLLIGDWYDNSFKNHSMLLVETEGSYTNQITLNSLDVHVGQSYSVLVTADQDAADYYIVATAKMANSTQLKTLEVVGVLHYENSNKPAVGPIPNGPDPFDVNFSISQARSIRWNLTTGAARPNPQGSFNVSNVTLSQTFLLQNSLNYKNGKINYAINNVSYATPKTPLKLADYYLNGTGIYELDKFPVNGSLPEAVYGTFVVSGEHKGWLEIVFKNELQVMDSWHLDGFGFFVVGYGFGNWTPESRDTYNLYDPVVRSTVQVYPKGWTAVYVYLDNPGMWNLRSQKLKNWFLGQELYIRVHDNDPNPQKEHTPPKNLLYCGSVQAPPSAPPPSPEPVPVPGPVASVPPPPAVPASTTTTKTQW
ncbi:hypothetical protein HAX54_010924 [Datura stramonium]|uniref:Monocopper oxidase-like protein SKU5 n=1 Tax=Datura stramonium TaxID=4076 RepID=A0ABS8RWX0_DATST|nr:hypothetical protein [Datura stramonium]